MKLLYIILISFLCRELSAQPSLAFTRISIDDGLGLNSNVVYSIHQDKKGFIWVGTSNGLQRFDGSKFISFSSFRQGRDQMPDAALSQIVALNNGKLLLAFSSIREFGLFDPSTFLYKKITLKASGAIPARAQFNIWKTANGDVYMNVLRYGIMQYDEHENIFRDTSIFNIPKGWSPSLSGAVEDIAKKQIWFACDSGLVVYNKQSGKVWHKYNNPQNLPILNNRLLQDRPSQFYIDQQKRIWVFTWPAKGGGQLKYCLDKEGENFLQKDTLGLLSHGGGYTEYTHFLESKKGGMWIYGLNVLFNWDNNLQRFNFIKSTPMSNNFSIDYEVVHQLMEDKDGSLWIATDRGLYFSSNSNDNGFSVTNLIFSSLKQTNSSITDILELPNGDYWFASWGTGVKAVDKYFRSKEQFIYKNAPPKDWPAMKRESIKLTWSLCRESASGNIFIGCNYGVLLIHNTTTRHTQYLSPAELDNSTIRFIVEDSKGQIWIGTQAGRLVKYFKGRFNIVMDIGTIIYKIYFDKQGWLWLATHEKGLYAVDPSTGSVLQHYTAGAGPNHLYSNTGYDIEQLNDSIIVYGAGCLNFINKKNKKIHLITYKEGLPSNNVQRLRIDEKGFLWIITSNGLSRYNPSNNRITPYGSKDGIILAEQTITADYVCSEGYVMFAGGNAVVMFKPSVFTVTQIPPDVSITDFKIFNQYVPVDSLQQLPMIKLKHDQNSFSIYFASLSYMQRDKLTYYYKLEGRDDNWIKANRWNYENYSLLPPGKYVFKIYSENIEGLRSKNITQVLIDIKPPFWRSKWFYSSVIFLLALLIYYFHNERVKRLLAVEKIRNRVARDLHDDMGSTLSTINILTSMAKTKLNTDTVKTSDYLGKISDNSQRMMDAMDDIVWSIKPSNDSMHKITARMREFAINVLEAKDIDLHFSVEEAVYDVKLDMESRRDFFLVFKEAVNNAAKYSKAAKVTVSLEVKNKKLQCIIVDNGIGFDVANADAGNGLGNMQKRAEAMRGTVTILSEISNGSTVTLKIPVS